MTSTKLTHDGVTYTLDVDTTPEGHTEIVLGSTRPPLGLGSPMWSFLGKLPTEEMEQTAAKNQRLIGDDLSKHDLRRNR